ncbi:MAG: polyprenyl synthetase family protein [Bacteroidota bacterium]
MYSVDNLRQIFLEYLNSNHLEDKPIRLYEPVNYIMGLGGKRLRPTMLLMGCQLFGGKVEAALPAAYAVEVFHNFTLLHDDVMDDAPLRRGQATVHEKYDLNTAILSGDVMVFKAYQYLGQIDNQLLPEIYAVFNQFAVEVCEGQQYDMDFETSDNVAEGAYLKMIELKTSVLLAGAMKIGAIIGGASAKDADHLAEFGRNVGIAFQLQDDILDTFGDPEKFGKKVGGDIAQNKKTYLVIKALELAGPEEKAVLEKQMATKEVKDEARKIEIVKGLFEKLAIREVAQEKMEAYLSEGFRHLEALSISENKKKVLADFARTLITREH